MSAAPLGVVAAGSMAVPDVLARLGSDRAGLTAAEAARRLRALGPNAVRSHRARAFPVLGRQLRSPLLILLAVTACASFFVGERSDAVIIGVILLASVGLGFVNEYRAEKAAEALHSSIRHRCVVAARRASAVSRRDRAGPRRCGRPAAGRGRSGRRPAAGHRRAGVRGVGADRRVGARGEIRGGRARRDAAGRAELLRADGHRGASRLRHRGGGRHGRAGGVRPDRPRPRGAPARDRVPGRAAQVLHAARPGRRGAHRGHLRHQRGLAPAGHRRAAVLARHRRRHLPAAAPGRRVHQPRRRVTPAGPAQGTGQAAGLHRGSRRHRRAVHRQDRHPDRGQPPLHALNRARRAAR